MRYSNTVVFLLASAAALVAAAPMPQVFDADANERGTGGTKAIENEIKVQESVALSQAGCAGAIIEGDACEKIDAEFQAKLANILGKDDAAEGEDDAAEADAGSEAEDDQGDQNKDDNKQEKNN